MKICPNCGANNDDNARICNQCGYRFGDIQEQNYQVNGGFAPPPPANYGYPQYGAQPKSKTVPILIALAAVLLAGVGILGGAIFMKHKHETAPGSSTPPPVATEAQEDKTEPSAEAGTEEQEEKNEPAADDILSMYKSVLSERTGSGKMADYALYDMDHDGTPELWVNSGTNDDDFKTAVFTYKDKAVKTLSDNMSTGHVKFGYDFIADQIVLIKGSDSEKEMMWYDIDDSGSVRFLISSGKLDYTKGEDYMLQYNVENLETGYVNDSSTGFDHLEKALSGTFKNPDKDAPAYQKPTSAPTVNKNNYTSFDMRSSTRDFVILQDVKLYGAITTNSDPLSLRTKPDSNADIILTMPKGSKVEIYGYNDTWYYVSYNEGNINYYGYASRDYITETERINVGAGPADQSNNTITSCNRFGTIYSADGSKVDGLTKSYLIDGGAATYERHDLTNGWHIKAVNVYYDGSKYWYELYDADDGDYYGWVDVAHISFY